MTHGSAPGFPVAAVTRRAAKVAALAQRPISVALSAAVAVSVVVCFAETSVADEPKPAADEWYVVGGADDSPKTFRDYLTFDPRAGRVDFGVVFSQVSGNEMMAFTSGPTSPRSERLDDRALMVSGTYDFQTGTMVTPRIVGGVGVSYLGLGGAASGALGTVDPSVRDEMAATAHIGFGADFDLGDSWAVSAAYQAMFVGENDREGRLGESRLDQKFVVGAKVRF